MFCSYRQSNSTCFPNPDDDSISIEKQNHFRILREVRGLVFDAKTKQIKCRPLHKFFNLNEMKETKLEYVAQLYKSEKFHVLEKLDGMMIGMFVN